MKLGNLQSMDIHKENNQCTYLPIQTNASKRSFSLNASNKVNSNKLPMVEVHQIEMSMGMNMVLSHSSV